VLSSDAERSGGQGGQDGVRGGPLASLQEKKEQRLRFMHRLYEETDGHTLASVKSTDIGEEFGWSDVETDKVVDYLSGERLLEYVSGGGVISLTHAGVVEVEAALDNPDQGTEHFPPAGNVILIGQVYGSQIQQGTVGSQQHASFNEPDRGQLQAAAEQLRTLLPDLGLNDDDRQEAEAELGTAEIQLGSNRPKWDIIKASFHRLTNLVERASVVATRSVELSQALDTLHKQLPGL
jgi:hypothetical protein